MISCFPSWGKAIFDDFLFSPMRESRFSMIFDFPSRGITCFRRFLPVVPLRKPFFPVFCSSYPYESFFFAVFRSSYLVSGQFFPKIDDLLPYLDNFSRKLTIYSRIWTDFLENRQFTIVSGQFFPKIDDLLPYLNEFPEKAKKTTISLLKTSFEMVFSY